MLTIPEDTIKRLFLYYRGLLESRQTEVISSDEMSRLTGFSAAGIRKDLSYFGQFGTPGKGYNVSELEHQIKNILGIDRDWSVVMIGVGNLGKALVTYPGLKDQGFNITQLFDSDSSKIGRNCAGLKIKDIKTIRQELQDNPVKIAVIAVPAKYAQEVVNLVVNTGVKAVLNFAPTRLTVPPDIKVLNIDMTTKLARLSYYLTQDIKPCENVVFNNPLLLT